MKNKFFMFFLFLSVLTFKECLTNNSLDFLKYIFIKTNDFTSEWLWDGKFTNFSKLIIHASLQQAGILALANGVTRGVTYLWEKSFRRLYWEVFYRNSSPYYKPEIVKDAPEPIGLLATERTCIDQLKYPDKYNGIVPQSIIFYGPPGTGKTLRARYIASETGRPFFALTPGSFKAVSTKNLSYAVDIFIDQIERYKGVVIIYIDEIDEITKKRSAPANPDNHDSDEEKSPEEASAIVLEKLMTKLSGFAKNNKVILMGSTNRPWTIDPALKDRTRQIYVGLPDEKNRQLMLQRFFHDPEVINLPPNASLDNDIIGHLAKNTEGFSGRNLRDIVKYIGIESINKNKAPITVGFSLTCLSALLASQSGKQMPTMSFSGTENVLGGREEVAEGIATFKEQFAKYMGRGKELNGKCIEIDWDQIKKDAIKNRINLAKVDWSNLARITSQELICNNILRDEKNKIVNGTPILYEKLFPLLLKEKVNSASTAPLLIPATNGNVISTTSAKKMPKLPVSSLKYNQNGHMKAITYAPKI